MPDDKKTPLVLAILDGWGFGSKKVGNPIATANKPTIDMLTKEYPMTLLQASGLAVGMTWGESGNSEVGHLNIGAGRIIEQYLSRINRTIKDGSFFSNAALAGAFDFGKNNSGRVHLVGLLTSGTVHADFSHIIALLELARQKNFAEVYLHLFLDGKDSGLQEAPDLLDKLSLEISRSGIGKIATMIGRNFAMDRDNNWDLTKRAYELLTQATGEQSGNLNETIRKYYDTSLNDSIIEAIVANDSSFSGINDGDALVFFNFREDSMRQILKPFAEQDFSLFPKKDFKNIYICTMTQYLESPLVHIAFMPPIVNKNLAEMLENNGKNQFHIAETEKYAHVTYFFNGLKNTQYKGEVDILIESNKNDEAKPAMNPERGREGTSRTKQDAERVRGFVRDTQRASASYGMKSTEIAKRVIEELDNDFYDFILLNFANPDVLAHTGNFEATVKGIEAVDSALGLIVARVLDKDGIMIVTADHGNAESLIYRGSGEVESRHNDSPVPFYLVGRQYQVTKTPEKIAQETSKIAGILADIAPTVLELMAIPQPQEMTGKSLLSLLLS